MPGPALRSPSARARQVAREIDRDERIVLLALGRRLAALLRAAWAQGVLVFLAVQLALSVFTRGDYLFTEVARSSAGAMPSDVAVIAAHLGGPYWAWGLACGLVSVLVLIGGLAWYRRGDSRVELHQLRAR